MVGYKLAEDRRFNELRTWFETQERETLRRHLVLLAPDIEAVRDQCDKIEGQHGKTFRSPKEYLRERLKR